MRERRRRDGEILSPLLRLLGQTEEERAGFGQDGLAFRCAAFKAHERIPRAFVGGQAPGKPQHLGCVKGNGKGATGLGLGTMSLIDDPERSLRQKAAIGGRVAEEQGVIRHDDMGALGLLARSMNEAVGSIEGAFAPEAIPGFRRDRISRKHAVVDLQAVYVIVFGLFDE